MSRYEFDYFYGNQAEQFTFYRLPKVLITDNRFKELSNNAKLLYGLMLDRMSLSRKCGWTDEEGKVYIKYSRGNIAEDLNIGKDTAGNLLKDLAEFGLIDMVQSNGKANIIFVKNFVEANVEAEDFVDQSEKSTSSEDTYQSDNPTSQIPRPVEKFNQLDNSRGRRVQPVENFDQSENPTSTSGEILAVPVGKSDTNDTKYNTKANDTDIISINREREDDGSIDDANSNAKAYMKIIKQNIAYDDMMSILEYGDKEMYDELYDIICDIVCVPRESIRVDSRDYPYEMVKSRFLKLNSTHLEYVIDSLRKCTSDISNIRAYLITALYNAPTTVNSYYQTKVMHDMYGQKAN